MSTDPEELCYALNCEFLMATGGCELNDTPDKCQVVHEHGEKRVAECEHMGELCWEARHDPTR